MKQIYSLRKDLTPISYGNHSPLNNISLSILFKPECFAYIKKDNLLEYPDNNHAIAIDMIEEIIYCINEVKKLTIKNQI